MEEDRLGAAPGGAALLDGGAEAYPRMLEAIAAARRDVRLELYALALDGVGERFIEALSAAARRGVHVAVVLDAWGSLGDVTRVADLLRENGCGVTVYNPLVSLLLGRLRRNHRKLLLVDDAIAFVGGINVGDAYGEWKDLAVEIRGAVAAWIAGRLRGQRGPAPPGPVRVHLSGLGGGRPLRRRYLKAIGSARRSLVVAHGYFLPDHRLVRSITAAARRGVKVTLVLPGRSDVPLARAASRRLDARLLRAGVRIHEWSESVLHVKAALADDHRLLLGSFNLDPLSLGNLEALVEVDDDALGGAGRRWMRRLVAGSPAVRPASVAARSRLGRWIADVLGLWVLRGLQGVARFVRRR